MTLKEVGNPKFGADKVFHEEFNTSRARPVNEVVAEICTRVVGQCGANSCCMGRLYIPPSQEQNVTGSTKHDLMIILGYALSNHAWPNEPL